jgi:FLVCR family feline leukemia virus subgroup C receptor-related protein
MVCFLVGQGGSYGISGVFVQLNHGKDQVGRLMIFNAIFCLVSLILVILLIKDKPSNDQSIQPNPKTVKEELGLLIRDFHFICLLVSSGIHMGVGNYFGVILEILVKGSGLTPEDASYIGVITILSGITSCIICSLITSRLYKYRIIIIVSVACTTVLYIFYFYAIQSKSFNLACFASFLYGIFLLPVYSIPLEFACETTFPVREILTSGLINCFAQIFSIIPILVSYWFKNKPWTCIEISVFFQLISLISVFFTKENLKRKHAEEILKVQNDLIPSYN